MQNMSGGKTALGLDSNVGALICYLGNVICALGLIYSIIVIVSDKSNRLPRFHAFQSVFLTVAMIAIMIPLYIVMFVGVFIDAGIGFPIISGLMSLLMMIIGIGSLVFVILAAVKAYNGEFYKIPVIGNLAEKYAG
jgi:uncharacterized membrane protein